MPTQVEVVTPQRTLFSGEAEMVVCRTVDGDIAFLANHMPFVGALEAGLVRLVLPEGAEEVRLAVHGGFVEVRDNQVTLLADVAELAGDIDLDRAQRAKDEAERRLGTGEDVEARAALRRAEVRLAVAEAVSSTLR